MSARVGVLGCSGAVGSAVLVQLRSADVTVLPAGRRRDPVRRVAGADGFVVDVDDPAALAAFCAECDLVVDCTGPAAHTAECVLRAAMRADADYAGAADCPPVSVPPGRRAVVAAGMTPGLSALLPRALAGSAGFDRLDRLTAYLGGRDRFTASAARDYLFGMRERADRSAAAWSGGRVVPGSLPAKRDGTVPHFPSSVTAQPFLTAEAEWLGRTLPVGEVHWYHVFDGERTLATLSRVRDDGEDPARQVVRAAELDLFGRPAYQRMVFELDGARGGTPQTETLVLHGTDSYELSAAMLGLVVEALLSGGVPPGLSRAGQVIEPAAALDRLAASPAVRSLDRVDGGALVEEGAL